MLDPLYNNYVAKNDTGALVIISPTPKDFKVFYYAQFSGYVLVGWERELFAGETLWLGKKPIASSGGALDLYSLKEQDSTLSTSIFQNRNAVGGSGIPKSIAIALRDPSNQIVLQT